MTRQGRNAHIDKFALRMLAEHGYVVVGERNHPFEPYSIGQIINGWSGGSLDRPYILTAETSREDWNRQMEQWKAYIGPIVKREIRDTNKKEPGQRFWKAVPE
jgi:hypothetical protein